MADITNELIFEVLMQNQLGLTNVENRQIDTSAQLVAIRSHLGAIQGDVSNIYTSLAHLDERVTRIERRLDIADQPAS